MVHYESHSYRNTGWWTSKKEKANLVKEGYKPSEYDPNLYILTTLVPAYSSQLERGQLRHIGTEPRGCGYSIHDHQYNTDYYEVSRADFECMAVKPELKDVVRPLRMHDFDGFVEPTQTERRGLGWTETFNLNYHTTITKHIFVAD